MLLLLLLTAGCSTARPLASAGPTAAPTWGGGPWTVAPQPTRPASEAERATIDAIAEAALREHGDGATALYLGVWDPARGVLVAAYGDAAPGQAATVDDHNRIGSVTKTFTATAVLDLVARGELTLDSTLGTVTPDLVARHPALAPVTIDQLLGMRTGIGDAFCCADAFTAAFFADPTRPIPFDDLVAAGLRAAPPAAVPPTEATYSNTNYVILGAVLDAVTGRPAEAVVTDIARKAGLRETALDAPDVRGMPEPAAHGFLGPRQVAEHADRMPPDLTGGTDVSEWSFAFARTAGGMYSTIEDLGTWAATGFGSTLLPADLAERRLSVAGSGSYGYGIMRLGTWMGHGGSVHGWITMTAFDTATGTTFVAIVNSGGGEAALEPLAAYLLPDAPFTQ